MTKCKCKCIAAFDTPSHSLRVSPTAGQWKQSIKEADGNDECSKILNSKRFMLDMLYAASKAPGEDEEKAGETETEKNEEDQEDQDSSVASLASRISTLEANRQAREENMKKIDVQHLDNQGSVRAVAEKFGDLVKGLGTPHDLEASERQQQVLQPDKAPQIGRAHV